MKTLFFTILLLISTIVNAALLGGTGDYDDAFGNTYASFDLADYQIKNTVSMEVRLPKVKELMWVLLPVGAYLKLFNSEEKVVDSVKNDNFELDYKAVGSINDRQVWIQHTYYDDDGVPRKKEVVLFKFNNNKVSISLTNTKHGKDEVKALTVDRSGIRMYGDNRGWPLGKILTAKNLKEAVKNPSESNLVKLCEAECNQ